MPASNLVLSTPQINLEWEIKNRIRLDFSDGTIFFEAQNSIFALMEKDSFQRFLKSGRE